jgi:hypothetical protein
VRIGIETVPGLKLRLDGSSDLGTWVPVGQTRSYSTAENLTDPTPSGERRFYRVVAEP